MTIQETHALSPAEVAQRIDRLLELLTARSETSISQPTYQWNADRTQMNYAFRISGQPVSGSIRIDPRLVTFEAKLPPVLTFFQSRIKSQIHEKIKEVLSV